MYDPAPDVSLVPELSDSLTRADALEREITNLCAHINAASYRLLQLIAELDEISPWGAWGLASCAHWLNWRCGIGLNAAREKVRVAHALKQLPLISASFSTGELSFSKARAITRIADADNESDLLELARHATAAQVEKLVRAYRNVGKLGERERANAQHESRELAYYYDDDGSLVIRARLPADEGAVVLQALNAAMDARGEEQQDSEFGVTAETSANENRFAQRRADALVTLAETTLGHGPDPLSAGDKYQVAVHVTAETLGEDNTGRCELDNGPALAAETVRRIGCDSSLIRITEDEIGNPLNVGRKTRSVPPAIRRALQARDGGCRFPGCTHDRFVDAHHIKHWADGGSTSIDNLVLLCRRHHRLVHEGGFRVERNQNGSLNFSRPDGLVIAEHPQLPNIGSVEGLLKCNQHTGRTIDAAKWIIPGDTLDYGIAVEGLLRQSKQKTIKSAIDYAQSGY